MNTYIEQLQQELTSARDFHYRKHWEQWQRDHHDNRIRLLEEDLMLAYEEQQRRWNEESRRKAEEQERKDAEIAAAQQEWIDSCKLKGVDPVASIGDYDWPEY